MSGQFSCIQIYVRGDLASHLLFDHPSQPVRHRDPQQKVRACGGPGGWVVDTDRDTFVEAGHFSVGSATHRVASIRRWWAARLESRPCWLCCCKSAVAETALQCQAIRRMMSSSDSCANVKPMRSPLYSGRVIGMSLDLE